MLSTTTGGASQSTNSESDTAEVKTTIAVESTSVESSKAASVQVNREPFTSLSPDQSKTMLDEPTSKHAKNATCRNNNNNSINANISNANTGSGSSAGPVVGVGVGVGTTQGATSTSGGAGGGQSLTSSSKSPANNAQNATDHSNTNSNSSSVSASVVGQILESEISADELVKKKQLGNREDDSAMLKTKQTTGSGEKESQSNNVKGSMTGVTSTAIIKEEPADLLGSLVNMKKEENFSPSMSPVGFGSLGAIGVPERSVTPVKMESNANSTKASSSISLNNDDIASCNVMVNTLDTERINEASSSSSVNASCVTNGPGHGNCVSSSLGINSSPTSGPGSFINSNTLGSCLDYMQQQNHIFVFSTQLANKGAESVLSGQFQTIIAYHCTQPATKSFLEDFFMKNPMKINKLQRQNSMGLGMPIPNTVGQQTWHGVNAQQTNNVNQKILQPQHQKLGATGAKAQFNHQSDNGNKRNSFADTSPAGGSLGNEGGGDLMCWETGSQSSIARNHIEGVPDSQAMKLMESVDSVVGGLVKCNPDNDSNIISLQGVKVPDENLTPQQRQHREEQLAKIKKMNQFLFPENDKMTNSDGGSMSNMMMNMSGGGSNANQMQRQMQLQAQVQAAQKSEHLGDDTLMPIPLPISGDVIGDMGPIILCNSGPKGNAPMGPSAGSSVPGCGSGPGASGPGTGVGSGTVSGPAAGSGQGPSLAAGPGNGASPAPGPGSGPSPGPGTATVSGPGSGSLTGSAHGSAPGTAPAPSITTATGPGSGQGPGTGPGPGAGPGPGPGAGPGPGQGPGPSSASGPGQGQGPSAASGPRSGCSPGLIPPGIQCSGSSNTSSLTASSPEIGGSLGGLMTVGTDKGAVTNQDGIPLSQGGMTQAEWNKIQQQFFEERLKSGKGGGVNRSGSGFSGHIPGQGAVGQNPGSLIHQPPVSGVGGIPIVNSSNPAMRNNVQGPPPPYHPTQRSASVPIATQSPNPSSPNNLSLPSPRTAGALGLPSNSPSMELSATSTSGNPSTTSTMNAGGATSKNCFQIDNGSPSSRHRGNSTNVMNLNSNPSTPLSHLSPKDLESFNSTSSAAELKSARPSPQRLRSPPSSGNHLNEPNNMDSRFPVSSPGLNHSFNAHGHLQNNPNTAMNAYKGPSEVNRQNCGPGGPGGGAGGPGPVQFIRRSDNMPLNPNSNNRAAQNKMTQNFDPISSLAQMSQQLTSCVSSVGSPAGGMNMIGQVSVDMNMEGHTGIVPGLDPTGMVDQINHGNLSNTPGNCHPMNPNLMNTMSQRMLSPKICGLGSVPNGVVRDGPSSVPGPGFHGILPPGARMMGRMPINFGQNFSPNIQVKASTPNTIQYMPVRSQNNNNNNSSNNNGSNIRMPPSIEFLQRYANPQSASGGGPSVGHAITNDGSIMIGSGPMNLNSPSEQQIQGKMGNNPNINVNGGMGMNFFQNCNQIPVLDDDNAMVGHEIGLTQGPMIRGMRPQGMRQHSGLGSRMPAPPGGGNIGNRQHGQFNVTPDSLECNDPTVMFNNVAGPCNSTSGMFAGSQQGQGPKPSHHHKSMASNMCQTQVAMQGPVQGPVQGQGHPVMGGGHNNSNLLPASGSSGGPSVGVNFVGPSSNDLKYAQQYHSFQQQLYATNTRSQQHQLQQQSSSNMLAMPPNLSPNPTFFVNK